MSCNMLPHSTIEADVDFMESLRVVAIMSASVEDANKSACTMSTSSSPTAIKKIYLVRETSTPMVTWHYNKEKLTQFNDVMTQHLEHKLKENIANKRFQQTDENHQILIMQ